MCCIINAQYIVNCTYILSDKILTQENEDEESKADEMELLKLQLKEVCQLY